MKDKWSIGIDIIEIKRFKRISISRHPRFYERVFRDYEVEYCLQYKDPYSHFAGIFAAKEAALKALNKFIQIKLSDISVYHNSRGRPFIHLDKDFKLNKLDISYIDETLMLDTQVSITHSTDIALAWAIAFISKLNDNSNEIWGGIKPKIDHVIQNEFQNRYISKL